jgi:hypothetical protein
MNVKLKLLVLFLIVVGHANILQAQFSLDIETGPVKTAYNDVRIPGKGGDFISLSDELQAGTKIFGRLKAGYLLNERSELLLLIAPLRFIYTGSLADKTLFQGTNFLAGKAIEATYQFNSYRLSYRYYLQNSDRFRLGLGLTLKIRDALIGLESGQLQAEKTDFGFVPLINFFLQWKPTEKFGVLLDGDALAAPQGRAEDVIVALSYHLNDNLFVKAGYRLLEGGAANNTVYTFSMFHYGVVGFHLKF